MLKAVELPNVYSMCQASRDVDIETVLARVGFVAVCVVRVDCTVPACKYVGLLDLHVQLVLQTSCCTSSLYTSCCLHTVAG